MTEQQEAKLLERLEDFTFSNNTHILSKLTPIEIGELVTEILDVKSEILRRSGKNNVPTLDTPMSRKHERINNEYYYRFSPQFGTVHLLNKQGGVYCKKLISGTNHAQYKPFATICTICKDNITSLESSTGN